MAWLHWGNVWGSEWIISQSLDLIWISSRFVDLVDLLNNSKYACSTVLKWPQPTTYLTFQSQLSLQCYSFLETSKYHQTGYLQWNPKIYSTPSSRCFLFTFFVSYSVHFILIDFVKPSANHSRRRFTKSNKHGCVPNFSLIILFLLSNEFLVRMTERSQFQDNNLLLIHYHLTFYISFEPLGFHSALVEPL